MTQAAPNPEDRQQLDALASRLAELQPASASGSVQAKAFYLAGMQAARAELAQAELPRRRESSRWLARAAIVGLMVGSSGVSYWAGATRNTSPQLAATPSVAESDSQAESMVVEQAGLPPDTTITDAANALVLKQSTAPDLPVDGANNAFEQVAFGLPVAQWLKLYRVTPDEYLRLVEARSTPPPPRNRADEAPAPDGAIEESFLRELYGTPAPSPLRQWLPML